MKLFGGQLRSYIFIYMTLIKPMKMFVISVVRYFPIMLQISKDIRRIPIFSNVITSVINVIKVTRFDYNGA